MDQVRTVEEAVAVLRDDHSNGARILATNALVGLRRIVELTDHETLNPEDLWYKFRSSGYRLTQARPSMAAAITSTITSALIAVETDWNEHFSNGHCDTNSRKQRAIRTLERVIQERTTSSDRLASVFLEHLSSMTCVANGRFRALTLSSSSSLHTCLRQAVTLLPNVDFTIYVLESRPSMEGACFAASFVAELKASHPQKGNVKMVVAPDSHVSAFSTNVDALLLGADRISSDGDVSNKMGSLAAALAIRTFSKADVIVVTETDKIARPGQMDGHKDEDNDPAEVVSSWPTATLEQIHSLKKEDVEVRNVYFEWVPKQYVDVYVTEEGLLDAGKIHSLSSTKSTLEDYIFDDAFTGSMNC